MAPEYCVITFYSTYMALQFERTAKKQDINTTLIPVPRQISSSCGLAGKFDPTALSQVTALCSAGSIEFQHIYKFGNRIEVLA